jgi:hypothetical protein
VGRVRIRAVLCECGRVCVCQAAAVIPYEEAPGVWACVCRYGPMRACACLRGTPEVLHQHGGLQGRQQRVRGRHGSHARLVVGGAARRARGGERRWGESRSGARATIRRTRDAYRDARARRPTRARSPQRGCQRGHERVEAQRHAASQRPRERHQQLQRRQRHLGGLGWVGWGRHAVVNGGQRMAIAVNGGRRWSLEVSEGGAGQACGGKSGAAGACGRRKRTGEGIHLL